MQQKNFSQYTFLINNRNGLSSTQYVRKEKTTNKKNIVKDYENVIYVPEYCENQDELDERSFIARTKWVTIIKEYVCCTEIWKGMGLMFFYQFAGYNVVSFYAASIIQHPQEAQDYLLHPDNSTKFSKRLESPMIENE